MSPTPHWAAIRATLLIVQTFGAANADASAGQRHRLRLISEKLRDDPEYGYPEVLANIREVMGPDWGPTGEWGVAIDALLDEEEPDA